MKKALFFTSLALILVSCSTMRKSSVVSPGSRTLNYGSPYVKQKLFDDNTFLINQFSQDETYGYTVENPIMVGGGLSEGAKNERRFLNAMTGPRGERVEYYRIGSCCHFDTKNSESGIGLIDMYSVTYAGLKKSITLYLNMYDSDTLQVPVGFALRY